MAPAGATEPHSFAAWLAFLIEVRDLIDSCDQNILSKDADLVKSAVDNMKKCLQTLLILLDYQIYNLLDNDITIRYDTINLLPLCK